MDPNGADSTKSPNVDPFGPVQTYPRSQMLPDAYRINGVVDGMKIKVIYNDSLLRSNFKALIIPEINSIDIDTEFDFRMCEMIMSSNYGSFSEG